MKACHPMARIRFQHYIFCTLLILFGCALCACATKEDVKTPAESVPVANAPAPGVLSATIDGRAWQATPVANKDNDNAIASLDPKSELVTIRGTSNSGSQPETIEITLKSPQSGTYQLLPDFGHLQTAIYSIGSDTSQVYFIHEKQAGEAVISESDGNRLAGTFSFDAANALARNVHITNGTFNVAIRR